MEKLLKEYYSIEEDNENQTLYVNQQTVSMRVWILITCIVIIVTLKKLYGSDSPSSAITFWLLIIVILIILTYTLSSPTGFVMWFIVIAAVALMKMQNSSSQ